MADGWYWIKWRTKIQKVIESEKIPTNHILEFPNLIESWSLIVEGDTSEPVKLEDGRLSQQLYANNMVGSLVKPLLNQHNTSLGLGNSDLVLAVVILLGGAGFLLGTG